MGQQGASLPCSYPHKGLGYTIGCGGSGATGGIGEAFLKDTKAPSLCTRRETALGWGPSVQLDLELPGDREVPPSFSGPQFLLLSYPCRLS